MKKTLSALLIVAPLALAGCGSDDKTYVVTPPNSSPSAGTVVVPNSQPAPAVQSNTTKVCPQNATTC
jgi:hypothetical protein